MLEKNTPWSPIYLIVLVFMILASLVLIVPRLEKQEVKKEGFISVEVVDGRIQVTLEKE